jgi:hypothetical protein
VTGPHDIGSVAALITLFGAADALLVAAGALITFL